MKLLLSKTSHRFFFFFQFPKYITYHVNVAYWAFLTRGTRPMDLSQQLELHPHDLYLVNYEISFSSSRSAQGCLTDKWIYCSWLKIFTSVSHKFISYNASFLYNIYFNNPLLVKWNSQICSFWILTPFTVVFRLQSYKKFQSDLKIIFTLFKSNWDISTSSQVFIFNGVVLEIYIGPHYGDHRRVWAMNLFHIM